LGKPRKSTQAPGQFLGYSLQEIRVLDHLLRAGPGVTVSLEVIADTGVEDSDGQVLVEEAKSRTTSGNPLSDRSEELWKTLRNWVDMVDAGKLDVEKTRFRIWVSRYSAGLLAQSFSAASNRVEAMQALDAARKALAAPRGTGDALPSRNDAATSLRSTKAHGHIARVLGADPEVVAHIIVNCEIEFGSGRSLQDLKAALEQRTYVPLELADEVLAQALGWVKVRITEQIEAGDPATISWDEFRAALGSIVRKLDRRDLLASVACKPSTDEVDRHLQFRTYVRQLGLVEADDDEKLCAVTDYIKAESDRVAWAETCRVIESSFDDFEKELIAAWRNFKKRCDISHKQHPPAERGHILYTHCFGHSSKLDGAGLPEHFCRGSFHRLSDDKVIGWHPDYRLLLSEITASDNAFPTSAGTPALSRSLDTVDDGAK
jgi:hypothetical protein